MTNLTAEQKLFCVKVRGLLTSNLRLSYVIAKDPTEAYKKVRKWLDAHDYGFTKDRELESITLVADSYDYTDVGSRLFL